MGKDLDLARGVVQIDEHAAVAHRPDAARDADPILGFDTRGEAVVSSLELARLVRACKIIGIRVDPERLEAVALADPHGAQRIFAIVHSDILRRHPTAARETGLGARSTTVSWKRRNVP